MSIIQLSWNEKRYLYSKQELIKTVKKSSTDSAKYIKASKLEFTMRELVDVKNLIGEYWNMITLWSRGFKSIAIIIVTYSGL